MAKVRVSVPPVPPGHGPKALDLDVGVRSGRRGAWCCYGSGHSFYAVTLCAVLIKDSDEMKNKEVDCPQRAAPFPSFWPRGRFQGLWPWWLWAGREPRPFLVQQWRPRFTGRGVVRVLILGVSCRLTPEWQAPGERVCPDHPPPPGLVAHGYSLACAGQASLTSSPNHLCLVTLHRLKPVLALSLSWPPALGGHCSPVLTSSSVLCASGEPGTRCRYVSRVCSCVCPTVPLDFAFETQVRR